MNFDIVEQNSKFIVTKDGKPITVPSNEGQTITTSFDNKSDAEKYLSILVSLKKMKRYQ